MEKIKINFILLSMISFGVLFLAQNFSFAANLPYIDKSKIRISAGPGKTKFGNITVENPNSESRVIKLYLEDWRYLPSGDGAKEFMPSGTLATSCANWINFSPQEFTIPAYGKQKISYSIKVPQGASGTYYSVLFFEMAIGKLPAIEKTTVAGMDLKVRIATLFYVEVEGTIQRKVSFENLAVSRVDNDNDLSIELDFANEGNSDATCSGSFYLMDKEGRVYARGEFNTVYTASGQKARLKAIWKGAIPKGVYDLVLTFDPGKALLETTGQKMPGVTKEAQIEIGTKGEVASVGVFK